MVCVVQVRSEVKAVEAVRARVPEGCRLHLRGSRWRRFLSETDMDGPPAGDQSSLESSKPGSELSRRDINNILTTVCCQVGCRKSDLAFLC
ncbi:insulin-like 5a [Cyclopterus lumpus]|uniref:insulin-like 5a n=1 Tax=Cyclopterus lumpus TaxID=8103 RepID=UPI001485E309|nr:insulin-like 5a [Cyclopterus lumpus]